MSYRGRPLLCLILALLSAVPGLGDSRLAATEQRGLTNRVANTSLKMPSVPSSATYAFEPAFGALSFTDPITLATPPGERNRLFVLEQAGRIAVITNLASPNRTVFLDISSRIQGGGGGDERGLLGMAFHPGYATNGYFFVYYSTTTTTTAGTGLHEQLSRFQVSGSDPNQAAPESEVPLLVMYDEAPNHNGGDVQFGPDGLLYVSLGDEGDGNDSLENTQRIDKDFWSSILRLDVDVPFRPDSLMPNPHPANAVAPGGIQYRIPADNPFVGATTFQGTAVSPASVRTEMFAIGFRNPWRFSFDSVTGQLYCGDVGESSFEEINLVVKGGNYGWGFLEGNSPGPKPAPPGATARSPLVAYPRGTGNFEGFAVIGGRVHRGDSLPLLQGAYIFADYSAGNVWALFNQGTNVTRWDRIAINFGIASFGVDPRNGDLLAASPGDSLVLRLVTASEAPETMPAKLSATGAFTDAARLTPSAGLVPYDVNLALWSDGARKQRWFHVPPPATLKWAEEGPWQFPAGTVWVKHFELERAPGQAPIRVETRLLVSYSNEAQTNVYGVTYRWGGSTNDATLVPEEGFNETFNYTDAAGVARSLAWHYPSRSECLQCHTRVGGQALGFNTVQLNRDFNYPAATDNQLLALNAAGYFNRPLTNLNTLRALARLEEESVSVEQRVRSYLAVNCVQCHQPGGSGLAVFDARLSTPLSGSRLINGPLNNTLGDPNARTVVPGSVAHSMIAQRLGLRGTGQMPPLGTSLVDTQALALVRRWITNDLAGYQTFADWQRFHFGTAQGALAQPDSDPDGDRADNFTEYLTGTGPNNPGSLWHIDLERSGAGLLVRYPALANRIVQLEVSEESHLPSSWRFLDLPENRPIVRATNASVRLPTLPAVPPGTFYRARVIEP